MNALYSGNTNIVYIYIGMLTWGHTWYKQTYYVCAAYLIPKSYILVHVGWGVKQMCVIQPVNIEPLHERPMLRLHRIV